MKIFLTGFMGSGKTTVGKRMADVIGFDFVDTDLLIEQGQGMSVSAIFAALGEDAFRKMEHDVLQSLLQRDFLVVSTGGGMPCFFNNMDLMLAHGKVVYLQTSVVELARRLIYSHTERPLVNGKSLEELQKYIANKLAMRAPFYQRASITVSTEPFSMERLLQSLQLMKS
ncbi:MAG: shikimate kinase [Bacteroidales bacterium]|jgi:shikimate kinase|nr:shikimate kinase [Bacteroidales bacterium]